MQQEYCFAVHFYYCADIQSEADPIKYGAQIDFLKIDWTGI